MKPPTWLVGDLVVCGQERGTIASRRSPSRGMVEIIVRMTEGPRAPGWTWPEGWTPQLGDGPFHTRCTGCGREFGAPRPFETFCATCERSHA